MSQNDSGAPEDPCEPRPGLPWQHCSHTSDCPGFPQPHSLARWALVSLSWEAAGVSSLWGLFVELPMGCASPHTEDHTLVF